jgi:hypothetical protein
VDRLLARIDELGGQDASPVVPLSIFFEGNDDPGSIAPNLEPHPGVRTFERVLGEIRARAEVSDVAIQIDEVMGGEWPYAQAAYVITTASAEDVHRWAAELQPDEYLAEEDEIAPWLGGPTPPGAPEVPAGHRVITLFWD